MKLENNNLEIFDGFHLLNYEKRSFDESVGGYDYGFMEWEFDDSRYVYYHKHHNYFIKIRYKEGKNFIFNLIFYAEKNEDYNRNLREVERMLSSLKNQNNQIGNWGKLKKRKIDWSNKRKFERLLEEVPVSLTEEQSVQRRVEDFFESNNHLKTYTELARTSEPNAKAVLVQLLARKGIDIPESVIQEKTYSELSFDDKGVPNIGREVVLYNKIKIKLLAKHKYKWEYVFVD